MSTSAMTKPRLQIAIPWNNQAGVDVERMAVTIMVPEGQAEQLYGQDQRPVEHGICDPCENVLIHRRT